MSFKDIKVIYEKYNEYCINDIFKESSVNEILNSIDQLIQSDLTLSELAISELNEMKDKLLNTGEKQFILIEYNPNILFDKIYNSNIINISNKKYVRIDLKCFIVNDLIESNNYFYLDLDCVRKLKFKTTYRIKFNALDRYYGKNNEIYYMCYLIN